MSLFHRYSKKPNPELETEKRLAASRARRAERVAVSLRGLQERNQFREQFALTLKGHK